MKLGKDEPVIKTVELLQMQDLPRQLNEIYEINNYISISRLPHYMRCFYCTNVLNSFYSHLSCQLHCNDHKQSNVLLNVKNLKLIDDRVLFWVGMINPVCTAIEIKWSVGPIAIIWLHCGPIGWGHMAHKSAGSRGCCVFHNLQMSWLYHVQMWGSKQWTLH